MKKTICAAAFSVMLLSTSSFAEDTPAKMDEKMKMMIEYGTPGVNHKKLNELVGNWKYTSTWRESADAKAETSTGMSNMKMIMNGRFLQQTVKGKAMGRPFEGMGLIGYDNLKKKYQSMWLDNMGTGMANGMANYDAVTQTLHETGEFSCPTAKDKMMTYRAEWKMMDKNHQTYTMWTKDADGKEFISMEMDYKRMK